MEKFTLGDLVQLLHDCAEQDESVGTVSESDAQLSFEDLGFDSLALFNVVARIEKRFGIRIGYDLMVAARTPNSLLDLVRERLSV